MTTLSWYGWLRLHLWMAVMRTIIRIWLRKGHLRSGILPESTDIQPTYTIRVPSTKDPKRSVTVNVFYPPGVDRERAKRLPVHLNVHGSGFMWRTFGAYVRVCSAWKSSADAPTRDSELAAYFALKCGCVVLDTDYSKAPCELSESRSYRCTDAKLQLISSQTGFTMFAMSSPSSSTIQTSGTSRSSR